MRPPAVCLAALLLAVPAPAAEVDDQLAQAIRSGDTTAAQAALTAGAAVERPVKDGITPLIMTAYYDRAAIASLLLTHGANAAARADDGYSALDIAIERGRHEVVYALLAFWLRAAGQEAGAAWVNAALTDIDNGPALAARLPEGATPAGEAGVLALCRAAALGHLANAKALVTHGVPVDLANRSGYAPLALAVRFGHDELAALLLAHGADVNAHSATKYGSTPLMEATRDGRTAIAGRLLAAGARVNEGDRYGDHALNWATFFGHTELVRLLLARGADPSVVGQTPDTALAIAIREKHQDIVELLRGVGAPAAPPAKAVAN
jgi:ankyrin repeat protein